MALFVAGMKCRLCKKPMDRSVETLFGTWGVWLSKDNPLWEFCDATLHWECYARWEHRKQFARSYFEYWRVHSKQPLWGQYWKTAYCDDEVLVTVNPEPEVNGSWIHLAETGSRFDVSINENVSAN